MFGEKLPDAFADGDDVLGFVAASDMATFEGVEEFEPVEEGWVLEGDPFDFAAAAFGTFKEAPFGAHVLGIDVALDAVVTGCGPTDFSFGSHEVFRGGCREGGGWIRRW